VERAHEIEDLARERGLDPKDWRARQAIARQTRTAKQHVDLLELDRGCGGIPAAGAAGRWNATREQGMTGRCGRRPCPPRGNYVICEADTLDQVIEDLRRGWGADKRER
jgi:hypothetical protein